MQTGSYSGQAPKASLSGRQWWVSATSALIALVLHLAVFSALRLGTSTSASVTPRSDALISGDPSGAVPQAQAVSILIDPASATEDERDSAAPISIRALTLQALRVIRPVRLSEPHLDVTSDEAASRATSTEAVDGSDRELLFGRYVNQIAQRIDRAWVRPGVPPAGTPFWGSAQQPQPTRSIEVGSGGKGDRGGSNDRLFKCRVQIRQSPAGEVLEVTLLSCDASPEWQASLVNAIQAASPLPSPPNAAVFTRSLVLDFDSAASRLGAPLRTASTAPKL